MNAFYESITEWYDFIFPADPEHLPFIRGRVRPEDGKILDIGCGTGTLAARLGEAGFDVTGIDSDAEMIRLSRFKTERSSKIRFMVMDMRDLVQHFGPSAFHSVICFGNTLVHLNTMEDVFAFVRQVRAVLEDGGLFMLQILNYDHVLDHGLRQLPMIENEKVRFERTYRTDEESGLLRFRTVLTVRDSGRILENEVSLLPIRKSELEAVMREAGFHDPEWSGGFSGNPLTGTSLPLVCVAVR
jgi:glycine/sarcosine N-methyltransferase